MLLVPIFTAKIAIVVCSKNIYASYFVLILILAGDIETNPGPYIESIIKDLSVCHINAQSMLNKMDMIAVELGNFDVITISETWLDPSISDLDTTIPTYQTPIRLDRNRHGGGVAVYFKNTIPFVERKDLIVPNLEAIWAEVMLSNKKVLIGTFYLHPRFSDWHLVEYIIEQATQICPNLILLGDFNQNLLDPTKSKNITSIINSFGLNQIIDSPTRITQYSTSLIDLILVSDSLKCTDKGTIEPFCSDHHAIYFSTNFLTTKQHCYQRKIWQYDNANFNEYRQKLNLCDWDMNNLSIEDQVKKISTNITHAANQSIPNKVVTIRPRDLPWIHNEIRKEIRKRNKIHQLAKRTNTPENWKLFREARNHVTLLIRKAKLNYFNKLATNLHQGNLTAKQWWKVAKQFLRQNSETNISLLIENNKQYCDPTDKANLLNNYFCEQSNVDDSHASLPTFDPAPFSINSIQISETDIEDVLKLLDNNKACGSDLINPRLLKEGAQTLSVHLCNIFNQSLGNSYFPLSWKLANVVPIFKKGDKTNSANYRPISLLSCIGKVFERCIFKHMHNYLISNNIIISAQSGFTPKDSATFQLIDIYDTILKAIDEGKEVRAVFCDISKAFDRVWHRGLLFKLRRIGVIGPLLTWFESYLDQRFQRVVLEGSFSEYKEVKAGVPQGSILGPMLFLIYINDIVRDIESSIKLFADDTTLYLIVEDPIPAANLMDGDLDKVQEWANTWLVKFNPQKTEEIIFSRKTTQIDHPKLSMNNVEIQRVQFHKHLGINFNSDCSWHEHIIDITAKAWKRIHLLRALKFQLDNHCKPCISHL